VVLEEESEGVPPTTAEEAATLAADLRRSGLHRLVFGSDYPVFDPRRVASVLAGRIGLSAAESAAILARSPFFDLDDAASAERTDGVPAPTPSGSRR
jgi:hypothetical protein